MTNPLMRDINAVADTMGKWIMEADSANGMGSLGEWISEQAESQEKVVTGTDALVGKEETVPELASFSPDCPTELEMKTHGDVVAFDQVPACDSYLVPEIPMSRADLMKSRDAILKSASRFGSAADYTQKFGPARK